MGEFRLRAREGDFIEASDGLIFDVKGLVHPPDRVIAYLRYVPDRRGSRERRGVKYQKVYDLTARANLLRSRWPAYLYQDPVLNREVQAIPVDMIKQHYLPTERFAGLLHETELDQQERLALDMTKSLVKETGIPASKIGVSGSILVGLHTARSDIDLVLYGSGVARKCHSKLQAFLSTCSEGFTPYATGDLRKLYVRRNQSASLSFQAFARQERVKVLQGKFKGTDYFIRCVKEWDEWQEAYGDREYYQAGRATVHATISDDSESIFTPCIYHLVHARATRGFRAPAQIVSFRGRFCEQAHTGEEILARGTLERVVSSRGEAYRLVIGENPRDCLMVVGRRG
jgi:predicted nucleotidyltransferase